MKQFKFLDWNVYRDAQDLTSAIIAVVRTLPKEYRFEIGSQLIRSSLSIALNIAEGSGKSSDKELNRFVEIALGSAYETLAALDTLRRNTLLDNKAFSSLEQKIGSICRQLGGLKKSISS